MTDLVPVTLHTDFLSAGKMTLLNRILVSKTGLVSTTVQRHTSVPQVKMLRAVIRMTWQFHGRKRGHRPIRGENARLIP